MKKRLYTSLKVISILIGIIIISYLVGKYLLPRLHSTNYRGIPIPEFYDCWMAGFFVCFVLIVFIGWIRWVIGFTDKQF